MHRKTTLVIVAAWAFFGFASAVEAADLTIHRTAGGPMHRVSHHHHGRIVRDYDGTPVLLRARFDGTVDAREMPRAQPHFYLNGQPVRRRYWFY